MVYAIIVVATAIALVVDPSVFLPYYIPKLFLLLIAGPVLLVWQLILQFVGPAARQFRVSIIEVLILGFLVWAALTNPSTLASAGDVRFWAVVSAFLLTVLVRQFTTDQRAELQRKLLLALWSIGTAESMIGFYQLFATGQLSVATKTPMIGTVGIANGYADLLMLGIIANIFLFGSVGPFWNWKPKLWRMMLAISAALMIAALLLNASRGALFALICGLTAILLLKASNTRNVIAKLMTLGMLRSSGLRFAIALALLGFILFGLYQLNPESSRGRLMIWSISAPMAIEHPILGVGYNRFEVEYLNYQARYFADASHASVAYKAVNMKQADNEYLQAFCETGVIGGMLFFCILFTPVYVFFRQIRSRYRSSTFDLQMNDGSPRGLPTEETSALFVLLVALTIHAFFDVTFHVVPTLAIMFLLLGLVPVEQMWTLQLSKGTLLIAGIFVAVFLSFCLERLITQYQSYREWGKGYEYVQKKHFNWALDRYRQALSGLPDQPELQFHYGAALVFTGSYSQGLIHLQDALKGFNDRNVYLTQGYANLQLGSLDRAEGIAKTALAMFPDHLGPRLLLGEIYLAKGDTLLADQMLHQCVRRETKIWSRDVQQVRDDATRLWNAIHQDQDIE